MVIGETHQSEDDYQKKKTLPGITQGQEGGISNERGVTITPQ